MQDVHLGELDLNLLVALRALLVERHVTRAAARVGLTQPAMSHALARLRAALGDPLLVRTRAGMELTSRGAELVEPLERALSEVSRLLARPAEFDPRTSRRTFRVATSDYVELVLLPRLLARIWEEAPGVDVRVRNLAGRGLEELEEDRIDLVLGPLGSPGHARPGLFAQRLMTERFVCVVREDHPTVGKRLGLDEFLSLPHALIAPRGDAGSIVDTALAKLGKRRRVAVTVPHFLVAPFLVEKTDLVLTLAERVARTLSPAARLRVLAPPAELDLPRFDISLVSHERHRGDRGHAWFRALAARIAKQA